MSLLLLLKPSGGGGSTAYTLTGLAGSYSLTGGTASLRVGRKITANAGAYTVTGGSASLKVNRKITGNAGSYSLTGGSATLTKSAGSVAYSLTGLAGNYSLSGGNASLKANRTLSGLSGAYAVTGNSATLTKTTGAQSYSLVGLPGAYQVSGGDAVLAWSGAVSGGGYDYPIKKRYIVEKNGKLHVYASPQAAADAIEAQGQTQVIESPAADRAEAQAADVSQPDRVLDIEQMAALARERQALELFQKQLAQMQYDALLRQYEQWQDEQDIEDILALL